MRRRRISIIWKLTIWYTSFLCLLAVIIVGVTYLVSGRIIKSSSKTQLVNVVDTALSELEYDDGELEADDELEFFHRGIYLSVYNENNQLVMGMMPKGFDLSSVYESNVLQTIRLANEDWYYYENQIMVADYGMVTVRGMMAASASFDNQQVVLLVLSWLSPIIILVAAVGGYSMAKRAFRPIRQMRETVEQINSAKDLTKRVNLGTGEDEIYKLGETFDQMFERLEEGFEREKQFTSDVSHELRTPVSVILSQCEYAMEQENGSETKEALTSIYHQTVRMSKMIGQLLVLSRSDQGVETLLKEELNISELLEIIIEDLEEKAMQKNIRIDYEVEKNIMFYGDETMLVRFFVNLITNAIKYGKDGGWIKVNLSKENGRIEGFIEDNGIGIAKEDQDKIFRRFYQVNPARTSTKEGSIGLGLSMVQWIANAHHGEVTVKSELGIGSKFEFYFPIEKENVII